MKPQGTLTFYTHIHVARPHPNHYLDSRRGLEFKNSMSGTFKAKYHGIYQFSVSIQFEGHSTYEFELVRGGRSGATQVLALGKSKNSEFGFQKTVALLEFVVRQNFENQFKNHHTHQVSVTVNAECWPNDPVNGENITDSLQKLINVANVSPLTGYKVYVKHYFGNIICETKGESGFSLFSGTLIHKIEPKTTE